VINKKKRNLTLVWKMEIYILTTNDHFAETDFPCHKILESEREKSFGWNNPKEPERLGGV
jgi:hypothetical protein